MVTPIGGSSSAGNSTVTPADLLTRLALANAARLAESAAGLTPGAQTRGETAQRVEGAQGALATSKTAESPRKTQMPIGTGNPDAPSGPKPSFERTPLEHARSDALRPEGSAAAKPDPESAIEQDSESDADETGPKLGSEPENAGTPEAKETEAVMPEVREAEAPKRAEPKSYGAATAIDAAPAAAPSFDRKR